MIKAAVTGTIGSGKSTLSKIFSQQGYPLFDADKAAAYCLSAEGPASPIIHQTFGDEVMNADGSVSHPKLASVVFDDAEKRSRLNAIVHPLVKQQLLQFFEQYQKQPLVFAEIPLLFQFGWEQYFDCTIVVTCSKETALQRLCSSRGYSRQQALSRLETQMPAEKQIAKADKVFFNDGTYDELKQAALKWLDEWKERQQ